MKTARTAGIYFLCIAVMCAVLLHKKDMHIDEFWSYFLANGHGIGGLAFEPGVWYADAEQLWTDGMSADSRFQLQDLNDVWQNQADDVHPPFYYLALHIICTATPGKFSFWQAGIVNILFGLLALWAWRGLIREFGMDGPWRDLCSVFYVTSYGVLQNVSFFRMYVAAMFFVTGMAWMFIRVAKCEKMRVPDMAALFSFVALGALTHYYCILYAAIGYMAICTYLVKQGRRKDALFVSCHGTVAGIASLAVFPYMLGHVLLGYRGTEAIGNLAGLGMLERLSRIFSAAASLNRELFGGMMPLFFIFYLVACKRGSQKCHGLIGSGISCMAYIIIVAMASPYQDTRYLFPIYGVLLAISLASWQSMVRALHNVKTSAALCIVMAICASAVAYVGGQWRYLYQSSDGPVEWAEKNGAARCVCLYPEDKKWHVHDGFRELAEYGSVMFLPADDLQKLETEALDDAFVVMDACSDGKEQERIGQVLELFPGYACVENQDGHGFCTSLLIQKQKSE